MLKAVFTVHSEPSNLPAEEVVMFAGFLHPRLKISQPVKAVVERLPGEVRAGALGVVGSGRSSGEALEALGRAIAARYYEGADSLLRQHIAEFPADSALIARRASV